MNAEAAEAMPPCTWGDKRIPCQFPQLERLPEFNGRHYCPAHAPLGTPDKWSGLRLQKFITQQEDDGKFDFSGVEFPYFAGATYVFRRDRHITLECKVEGDAVFAIEADTDLSGTRFLGTVTFRQSAPRLTVCNSVFAKDVTFEIGTSGYLDASASTFGAEVEFQTHYPCKKLNFRSCRFTVPPKWTSHGQDLPHNSSFAGASFSGECYRLGSEADYRHIRNGFAKNRDREQEGLFYSLEKRALRKSLGLEPRAWIPRTFSALYDWLAAYGRSYERALGAFVGVQAVFAVVYSWLLAGRVFFFCEGKWSPLIAMFTVAQVLKPFELFAPRTTETGVYKGVCAATHCTGSWPAVTALHSVLSLAIVALFFLALRWRFRRD